MNTNRSVKLKDVVEHFQMEVIHKGPSYDNDVLTGLAVRGLF